MYVCMYVCIFESSENNYVSPVKLSKKTLVKFVRIFSLKHSEKRNYLKRVFQTI